MAVADELASIPLFASLSADERDELAGWFDERTASEGVRLVGEGAAGYCFLVLVEGSAVVTEGEATLATLGPGDPFGEMSILGDGRRLATVTTTSPSRLLFLFGTEFRRLQQMHPGISERLEELMRTRLAERDAAVGR